MRLTVGLLASLLAAAAEMPRIEKSPGGAYRLMVDSKPFIILSGQVHNSSGWHGEMEKAWPVFKKLNANTAEVPVYWEVVEPAEGRFDFSSVDALIQGARKNDLRLVLLWFGTWKNGVMDYAPVWVKLNPERFPRMKNRAGDSIRVLSPLAEATRTADAKAFAAFMRHLKEVDGERHTVIMVQVENEAGSLDSDRDYSPVANRVFEGQAPPDLVKALGKKPGTWRESFGAEEADEAFAAYYVARFVNEVAGAGKREYALPLYANVWLRERKNFERPGEAYPSGGATSNMLDLWKALTPNLEAIAPDNYVLDYAGYRDVLRKYSRPDNPLLVPETAGGALAARYMFYAIGEYRALGFAPFGIDGPGAGSDSDAMAGVAANYRLFGPAAAEISRLQQAGAIQVAVEEDRITDLRLTFPRFESVVTFGMPTPSYGGLFGTGTKNRTGRALLAALGEDEFLIAGFDALVRFMPRRGSAARSAQFVRAEEGSFVSGEWKCSRVLNGDQTFFGVWLPAEGKWVRVKLMAY